MNGMNEIEIIQSKIYEVRGRRVMLDTDLAELYQVETRVLNQAVKRNESRFPEDFMFRLTDSEWATISSQFVMTSTNLPVPNLMPSVKRWQSYRLVNKSEVQEGGLDLYKMKNKKIYADTELDRKR